MLKCIRIEKLLDEGVEEFSTYEQAAMRLLVTPDYLRTALSSGRGEFVRKSSPIGAIKVTRVQEDGGKDYFDGLVAPE